MKQKLVSFNYRGYACVVAHDQYGYWGRAVSPINKTIEHIFPDASEELAIEELKRQIDAQEQSNDSI